jgi:alcohol dehydrogenase, propanol-preferring
VTVYKALKESGIQAGEWVVIPGAGGGLGHLAVQYAKYLGARVIGIDTGPEKKALVQKLGAEAWIDFKKEKDLVKAVQSATPDGLGPHAAIVAAAGAAAYELALEYVRPHGVVVCVGLPPGTSLRVARSLSATDSVVCFRQDPGRYLLDGIQIEAHHWLVRRQPPGR